MTMDCIVPTYGNQVQPAAPIWGRPPPYPRAYAAMLDPDALGVATECVACVTAYKVEREAWDKRGVGKVLFGLAAGGAGAGAVGYLLFRQKGYPVMGAIGAVGGSILGGVAGFFAAYAAMKGSEP